MGTRSKGGFNHKWGWQVREYEREAWTPISKLKKLTLKGRHRRFRKKRR